MAIISGQLSEKRVAHLLDRVETPEAYFGSPKETEIENSIFLSFFSHLVDPSPNKLQPNYAAIDFLGLDKLSDPRGYR
jgi:hypothetical protein